MKKALKVVNELKRKGIIKNYAIADGIAMVFYVEPVLTYDLHIFFVPHERPKKIMTLSPIYDALKKKGYKSRKEHVVVEGLPVQFIPAYNRLVEDAVDNAVDIKYQRIRTRVLRAEYLIAIMLQTSRAKDKERMIKLLDEARIDRRYLRRILRKHGLEGNFNRILRSHYE